MSDMPKKASFSPFYAIRANGSLRSSLSCSFLKSDGSHSISLPFIKERPEAIRSDHSWQKGDGRDSLFFMSKLLFRSFTHKNDWFTRKNRWANSQPCLWQAKTQSFWVNWYLIFSTNGKIIQTREILSELIKAHWKILSIKLLNLSGNSKLFQ